LNPSRRHGTRIHFAAMALSVSLTDMGKLYTREEGKEEDQGLGLCLQTPGVRYSATSLSLLPP